jgi:hypothetical protein
LVGIALAAAALSPIRTVVRCTALGPTLTNDDCLSASHGLLDRRALMVCGAIGRTLAGLVADVFVPAAGEAPVHDEAFEAIRALAAALAVVCVHRFADRWLAVRALMITRGCGDRQRREHTAHE